MKKDLAGKPVFPGGRRLERLESGIAENIKLPCTLFPMIQPKEKDSLAKRVVVGGESVAPCLGGCLRSESEARSEPEGGSLDIIEVSSSRSMSSSSPPFFAVSGGISVGTEGA